MSFSICASKETIIVSSFLFLELQNYYTLDQIRSLSIPFKGIIEMVGHSEQQSNEAIRIARERRIPYGDVLHAILARDNKSVLISRDKHFQLLKDICSVFKPEEIV